MTREEMEKFIHAPLCMELYEKLKIIYDKGYQDGKEDCISRIGDMPSVQPKTKTGHCEDCKHFRKLPYHADTLGKCIYNSGICPKGDWYCADFEPQESEDKE